MRQIILDTETTGFETREGHRLIELGCLEMMNRKLTGRTLHFYFQPDREIDAGAVAIHGITSAFLQDKPRFKDHADDILSFLKGAELVIHNASFDIGFLNHELSLVPQNSWGKISDHCSILDTLKLARELHPGQKNSLDALCKRYDINNSHREYHGALLDAELLAHVYLAMTSGQESLLDHLFDATPSSGRDIAAKTTAERTTDQHATHQGMPTHHLTQPEPPVILATPEELEAHAKYLELISKQAKKTVSW